MLRPALFENNWLRNYFDDFERSFFDSVPKMSMNLTTDVVDNGDSYLLKADLPGFDREDIQIEVKDGYLTISADHKEENEEKDEKQNFIRRERRYGSVRRSFQIGDMKPEDIKAEYKNGVLALELPKKNEEVPVSHRIEVQ